MFVSIILFTQKTSNNHFQEETKCSLKGYDESFEPDRKLLNEDIWTRVCFYRFECKALQLAVEWENHEYVLMELNGGGCILARDKKYANIARAIIHQIRPKECIVT